jgi:hypothetical protein
MYEGLPCGGRLNACTGRIEQPVKNAYPRVAAVRDPILFVHSSWWCSCKLSNAKAFSKKLLDVVGRYVSPPAHAIVLSVYEKSQILALGIGRS